MPSSEAQPGRVGMGWMARGGQRVGSEGAKQLLLAYSAQLRLFIGT